MASRVRLLERAHRRVAAVDKGRTCRPWFSQSREYLYLIFVRLWLRAHSLVYLLSFFLHINDDNRRGEPFIWSGLNRKHCGLSIHSSLNLNLNPTLAVQSEFELESTS